MNDMLGKAILVAYMSDTGSRSQIFMMDKTRFAKESQASKDRDPRGSHQK